MDSKLIVPSEFNSLRVMSALETIVTNLDKISIWDLERFVNERGLINNTKR